MDRRALLKHLATGCFVSAALLAACNRPAEPTDPSEPDLSEHQASGRDECLEGDWVMRTADLDLLVVTLVPVPNLRIVAGSLFLSFSDGAYRYGSDGFVEHVDLGPGKYLEGTATFLTTGSYAAEVGSPLTGGSAITFLGGGAQKEVTKWLAFKDGRSEEAPGGGPQVSMPLSGRMRYSCSEQELILYAVAMSGEVPMFFKRP